MKNEDVKDGLVVITTVLREEDPDCFYRFIEGRVPGLAGVINGSVPGAENNNPWLVVHVQGEGEGTAYDASEFEPLFSDEKIEAETYFSKNFCSNECCICGKSPTFGSVSFWLSFELGTHESVYFCEKHLNHVDILKGIGQALTDRATRIEQGLTWRGKNSGQGKKPSYLTAITAVDYDHCGCPHCSYQRPGVEFVPDTISCVRCEGCGMPYAVFADGVRKKSAMVEMLFGYKARAVLQECPCEKHYLSDWVRVFLCRNCLQKYPSDREGTSCNLCNSKIIQSKVPREDKNKGIADGCT